MPCSISSATFPELSSELPQQANSAAFSGQEPSVMLPGQSSATQPRSYHDLLSSPFCTYSCFHIHQAHSLLSFQATIQMQSLICCLKGFQIMQQLEKSLICLRFVVSMLCIVCAAKKKVLGSQDLLTLCSLMDWGSGGALWGKEKIAFLLRITECTWLEFSRGQDRSSQHVASKEHKKKLKTPGRSRD